MPARINGKLTKEYKKKMYWRHRDRIRVYRKKYEHSEANQRARQKYRTTLSVEQKERIIVCKKENYRDLRNRFIDALGAKCASPDCLVPNGCTDRRCLQIDHINGDGYIFRKNGLGSSQIIYKYINHLDEAKKIFQVLCANCNWIKRFVNNEQALNNKNGKNK